MYLSSDGDTPEAFVEIKEVVDSRTAWACQSAPRLGLAPERPRIARWVSRAGWGSSEIRMIGLCSCARAGRHSSGLLMASGPKGV